MGVVYKINQKIIDFITQKKQKNNMLSCRTLSLLVEDVFKIKISKSSISSILKESHLSSSVGRRSSASNNSKTFYIPEHKKVQIAQDLSKSLLLSANSNDSVSKEKENLLDDNQDVVVNVLKQSADDQGQPTLLLDSQEASLTSKTKKHKKTDTLLSSIKEKALQSLKKDIGKQKQSIVIGYSHIAEWSKEINNLGCIFLKAAQWALNLNDFLGVLISKYSEEAVVENMADLLNAYTLIQNHPVPKGITPSLFAPFLLNNITKTPDFQKIPQYIENCHSKNKLYAEYLLNKRTKILMVRGYKITMRDETVLFLSPLFKHCRTRICQFETIPIDMALNLVAKQIISNNDPICFYFDDNIQKEDGLIDFLFFAEKLFDKNAIVISLLDTKNNSIASFPFIPVCKRNIIIGINTESQEFSLITKTSKWVKKQSFYCDVSTMQIFFTDTKTDYFNKGKDIDVSLRVFTLYKEENTPFFAIITNNMQSLAEEIINSFIFKHPNILLCQKNIDGHLIQEEEAIYLKQEEMAEIINDMDIISDFRKELMKHCLIGVEKRNMLKDDINNLFTECYTLSGKTRYSNNSIEVQLNLPKNHSLLSKMTTMLYRFNEHNILDDCGRRLLLSFVEK